MAVEINRASPNGFLRELSGAESCSECSVTHIQSKLNWEIVEIGTDCQFNELGLMVENNSFNRRIYEAHDESSQTDVSNADSAISAFSGRPTFCVNCQQHFASGR